MVDLSKLTLRPAGAVRPEELSQLGNQAKNNTDNPFDDPHCKGNLVVKQAVYREAK